MPSEQFWSVPLSPGPTFHKWMFIDSRYVHWRVAEADYTCLPTIWRYTLMQGHTTQIHDSSC